MATTYQLWDTDTRNLVAEFDTREEALAAVKRTLEVDGRELAETLFLGVDEEGGAGGVIAQGAALVALAQGAARDPGRSGATASGPRDGVGEQRRAGQSGTTTGQVSGGLSSGTTRATGYSGMVGGEVVGNRAADLDEDDRGAIAGARGHERDEGDIATGGQSRRR